MEAILMDVKRVMRSLHRMMHAVSGAWRRHGVESGSLGASRYRSFGDERTLRDIYGREGRTDIYSSREMVEFHKAMSFGKQPWL
jgi:hypothetical protein